MSEGLPFSGVIDDENPRYVSEWDYFKVDRDRDFDEFYINYESSVHYPDIREGKSYRESKVISGRTAEIALIPYKNESSYTSYAFVLGWRDLVLQGDIRPDQMGDKTFPYIDFRLTEQGDGGEVLLAGKIETVDDLQEYLTLEVASETASEILLSFFSGIVYDLERGAQLTGLHLQSDWE